MAANTLVSGATFQTSSVLGVDVTANYLTYASAAASSALGYQESDWAVPPYAPGQIVLAGSDNKYILAQVSSVGSIPAGAFVAFLNSTPTNFVVDVLGSVYAATGPRIGINQTAQVASTSNYTNWCWIAIEGSQLTGTGATALTVRSLLYVATAGTGLVTSVSASAQIVSGAINTTSAVSASGSVAIVCGPMMISNAAAAQGSAATQVYLPVN